MQQHTSRMTWKSNKKDYLRDLSIFNWSAVVRARRIGELEGYFTSGRALVAYLSSPARAIVGVLTLGRKREPTVRE